jgi:hypothetical protein
MTSNLIIEHTFALSSSLLFSCVRYPNGLWLLNKVINDQKMNSIKWFTVIKFHFITIVLKSAMILTNMSKSEASL